MKKSTRPQVYKTISSGKVLTKKGYVSIIWIRGGNDLETVWKMYCKKRYVSIIWIRGDNDLEVVWKMYCKKKIRVDNLDTWRQ